MAHSRDTRFPLNLFNFLPCLLANHVTPNYQIPRGLFSFCFLKNSDPLSLSFSGTYWNYKMIIWNIFGWGSPLRLIIPCKLDTHQIHEDNSQCLAEYQCRIWREVQGCLTKTHDTVSVRAGIQLQHFNSCHTERCPSPNDSSWLEGVENASPRPIQLQENPSLKRVTYILKLKKNKPKVWHLSAFISLLLYCFRRNFKSQSNFEMTKFNCFLS